MKHLTSTAAETRVNPPSPSVEEVASTETADCLVAIDVETCVGEDDPSTEGVDPNPSGQIGATAAVSPKDTALQVAALTDQVGLLTGTGRSR